MYVLEIRHITGQGSEVRSQINKDESASMT